MEKAAQLAFENRKKKRSSTNKKSKKSKKRKSKKDLNESKGSQKVSHSWDYFPFSQPLPKIHDILFFPDIDNQNVGHILEKIHRRELEKTKSKRSTQMYYWPFHVLDSSGEYCATRTEIRDVCKCSYLIIRLPDVLRDNSCSVHNIQIRNIFRTLCVETHYPSTKSYCERYSVQYGMVFNLYS